MVSDHGVCYDLAVKQFFAVADSIGTASRAEIVHCLAEINHTAMLQNNLCSVCKDDVPLVDDRGFSPLKYELIYGRYEWGRPLYITTADLWFYKRTEFSTLLLHRPKGYVTDFASVPWPFSIVFPPAHRRWREAAVFHDDACDQASRGEIPRQVADFLFYTLAWHAGATWWERELMYAGTRIYGLTGFQLQKLQKRKLSFRTRYGRAIYDSPDLSQHVAIVTEALIVA